MAHKKAGGSTALGRDSVSKRLGVKIFGNQAVKKGDVILVKGSQGMRMERIVGAILLDQKNREKLLVRQDEEWLKKQ